jgi:hypothetical protein
MDEILFTLVVTLPIIAISVLVWLWVRRSATPETAARRRKVLYSIWITFCVAGLLYKVVVGSRLYRSIVGIATVTFSNNSGMPLQQVVIVTRAADGGRLTNNIDSFPAGGSSRLSVRTSDLELEYVGCLRGGQALLYTNGGLACPGEVFRVRLDSAGRFTSSYH